MKEEQYIQTAICNYIRANYPDVIFTSDLSGIKLSIGAAKRIKSLKSSRGIPDLLILHPNKRDGYHGLMLEIKTEYVRLYKKDGSGFLLNDHIAEQAEVLHHLRDIGYAAFFVQGIASAKNLIDEYMKGSELHCYQISDESLLWINGI